MAIKLRALVKQPSRIEGSTGLTVAKENGVVNVALDLDAFSETPSVADPSATTVLLVTPAVGTVAEVVERMGVDDFIALALSTGGTVTDSLFTVSDNADATKKFQFQASGIATATTRTYTMPDADTMLVGTDTTQTLSGKTMVAPVLGGATATSINKLAITAPATGATLTIADGKTLTVNETLVLNATGSSTVAFGGGGTVAYTSNKLSAFAATTSAELAGVISDETGSGALVFAASPTLTGTLDAAAANFSGAITFGTGTITALTNKASPNATNDYVIIYDAAGTAIKKATVGAVGSAGAVSSIAGNTGAFTLGNGIDNATNQIQLTAARRTLPTVQTFLSGSGTYTTPANCLWIDVEMVGGGGGGGGEGVTLAPTGANGGSTTFDTLSAAGGSGGAGNSAAQASGGTGTNGDINQTGGQGEAGTVSVGVAFRGGAGGVSFYGGNGQPVAVGPASGGSAAANSGSGGAGASPGASTGAAAGGGAGGYVRKRIGAPAATYSYAVGAGGAGGIGTGTGAATGGAGAAGRITVWEHYGT